jgi:hypothetical protein
LQATTEMREATGIPKRFLQKITKKSSKNKGKVMFW